MLIKLFPVRSVADVGGGVGAWAATFLELGVPDVIVVHGDYVNRDFLLVPHSCFRAHDLARPLYLGRSFDLVLSLEVAEHLPPQHADTFVESLTRHGDLIIFSAAIPGQGGTDHLNEQWPTYWSERFARHGFEAFDILRPRLWHETGVGFWFRQTCLCSLPEQRRNMWRR